MMFLKQLSDPGSKFSFFLMLGFLFCINFSIAASYIFFTALLLIYIVFIFKYRCDWKSYPGFFRILLMYSGVTLVSTLFSVNMRVSLRDNKELFIFLLVPLFYETLRNRKRIEKALKLVLVSAFLSAGCGYFSVIKNGIDINNRIKGFTSHWMTYSGLLMLVLIFFAVYFFYVKKKSKKVLIAFMLLFISGAVILSLTRNVWLGIGTGLSFFIIYYKPKILFLLIPILAVSFLFMPQTVKKRFYSFTDMNDMSNKDRFYMYEIGCNMFKDNPLTGTGADTIPLVYENYISKLSDYKRIRTVTYILSLRGFFRCNVPGALMLRDSDPAVFFNKNPHLHNNFLQILAERGIAGMLIFIYLFVYVFINLYKLMKKSPDSFRGACSTALFFMLTGYLAAGMFEYNFGHSQMKFMLLFFMSIPFLRMEETVNDIK